MIETIDPSRFDLGAVLGVGTVGTIYEAVDTRDGSVVAMKKLHPGVSRDPLIRARFEREMLILGTLRHPNIIRYLGGGQLAAGDGQPGLLFYVMELVDGGTVKDLIAGGVPLRWPVVAELTRQVCSALQCAHNHGVVHRDLKPGNLFLRRDGELKLGDFGIARQDGRDDLTHSGMTVGTHAYMAPEQITGDASISGKADLYALGCCMFEMLTARKVFQAEHFAGLFEQHLRGEPTPVRDLVPDVPAEMNDVIAQCLAKRPEDRPFNARTVQGVMNEVLERCPKEDEPPPVEGDVAAEDVSEGRRMLQDRIAMRDGGTAAGDVPLKRLLIVLGVLAAVVALAASLD